VAILVRSSIDGIKQDVARLRPAQFQSNFPGRVTKHFGILQRLFGRPFP
jgi:hypothetical protein